jgi:hypothetical protein
MHPYIFQAFQATRERELDRDLEHFRMMVEMRAFEEQRPSRLRRVAALGFAAVSLGAAGAVRRLDDCVADDLGRSLAATD